MSEHTTFAPPAKPAVNASLLPLEKDKPWHRAIEAFFQEGFTFGSLISLGWFHHAMDIPLYEDKTSTMVTIKEYQRAQLQFLAQFKKMEAYLVEHHNMHLQNVPGAGYQVVLPGKQTQWAVSKAKKEIFKALRSGRARLTYIEHSALTEKEKAENQEALGQLAFFRRETRKALL